MTVIFPHTLEHLSQLTSLALSARLSSVVQNYMILKNGLVLLFTEWHQKEGDEGEVELRVQS